MRALQRLGGCLGEKAIGLDDGIKLLGKHVLGRLCVYRLVERPIFLFSSRRSGSTLLMRWLHSQPNVEYVDEPLNLWRLNPHYHRLPRPQQGMFVGLGEAEENELEAYFSDLLCGRIRFRHRGNILDSHRSFLAKRLVVKNINANAMIEWFHERFNADIIYLIRHPIPIALSLIMRDWGNIASAYLENRQFCDRHVSPDVVKFSQQVLERGSPLQRFVLEWCLENAPVLGSTSREHWLTLTYEELVCRPREVAELLCSRLGLPDPERMSNMLDEPSRTTTEESRIMIRTAGAHRLADKWQEKIGEEDIRAADEILQAFGVSAYAASTAWPHPALCHFGPLGRE